MQKIKPRLFKFQYQYHICSETLQMKSPALLEISFTFMHCNEQ